MPPDMKVRRHKALVVVLLFGDGYARHVRLTTGLCQRPVFGNEQYCQALDRHR
jgi:hypothetical protein